MEPVKLLASKASEAVQALYGAAVDPSALQIAPTRKEFEGDYTLVVFPLLRISHAAPDATAQAIGAWLQANVPEVASFNVVKGFLNIVLSPLFWGEVLSDIAERIFARLSEGKRIDPASLIDEYSDDPELRLKASAIFGAELPEDEKEAREVLSDNLRIVRKAYINNALRSASDPARLQELMLEKASADKMTLDGII